LENDVVELLQTKWELKGLSSSSLSSQFTLCVKGTLYPEREGKQSHLKGHLEMGISLVRQPLLSLVPDSVLEVTAETVRMNMPLSFLTVHFFMVYQSNSLISFIGLQILKTMAEEMKHGMDVCLPKDFNKFRREKLTMLRQSSQHNKNSRPIKN
jgi:Protein of unknown function (DUF1997)